MKKHTNQLGCEIVIFDAEYHPHYPDRQNDYWIRLMNNAHLMADRSRLMCYRYDDEPGGNGFAAVFSTSLDKT